MDIFWNKVILYIGIFILVNVECHGQYAIKRLPYPINTKDYDEICPVMNFEESILFFTRAGSPSFNKTLFYNGDDVSEIYNSEEYDEVIQKIYSLIAGRHLENPYSSSFNQDVWMAKHKNGQFENVFHPGYPLNDALPNSICSTYGDESQFVVINQFEKSGGMQEGFSVVNQNEDGSFDFPIPFRIRGFDKSASEVNLTMSLDKQHLILAFESADHQGKKDLYHSVKLLDTLYSEPEKIVTLNTAYNETTPFLSHDKKRLYFATDRPETKGGLDIYFTDRLDVTYLEWSPPKPLNPALNTNANESHPYVTKNMEDIYYTSNRDGNSDIFTAKLNRPKHLEHDVKVIFNITKEGNEKNGPAEMHWGETYSGKSMAGYQRTRDGIFEYTFDKNEVMSFSADNRAYRSQIITIDPQELIDNGKETVFVDLVMTNEGTIKEVKFESGSGYSNEETIIHEGNEIAFNTEVGKTTVLDNIYFVRGRPEVRSDSYGALRKLAKGLKQKPNLVIRVEGHTDNIGDKEALKELSIARAEYIKGFLIREGVKEEQVLTAGFGEERPLTDNSNEKARKLNRRVEIRIIKE